MNNFPALLSDYLEVIEQRELSLSLNPPATSEDIQFFENEHGFPLPENLIELYHNFNGQADEYLPPNEPRWLALNEIFAKQQEWQEFYTHHLGKNWESLQLEHFEGENFVKNQLFNPLWLPFMADETGFFCLDYDPAANGTVGQIIYVKIATHLQESNIFHLATNFATWFKNHLEGAKSREKVISLASLIPDYVALKKANKNIVLNDGAKASIIAAQESYFSVTFPTNLKKIWSFFNGYKSNTSSQHENWIPVQEIESAQKRLMREIARKYKVDPEKDIRPYAEYMPDIAPCYFHRRWLPIYELGDLVLVLDYSVNEDGEEQGGRPLIVSKYDSEYGIIDNLYHFDEWLYHIFCAQLPPQEPTEQDENAEWFSSWLSQYFTVEHLPAVIAHYHENFGKGVSIYLSDTSHYDIPVFIFKSDNPKQSPHRLITCGTSQYALPAPQAYAAEEIVRYEFMMCIAEEWDLNHDTWQDPHDTWPVEWLTRMSNIVLTPEAELNMGHVVLPDLPDQFIANSPFAGVMILPPQHLYAPATPVIDCPDGTRVRLLALFPLFSEEVRYYEEFGREALLALFEEKKILETLSFERENVCADYFAKPTNK